MSVPYLTLTDSEGNAYNFPNDFWIKSEPVNTNKNVVNRTYAAGGKNIADGFLGPKQITIGGAIRADTLAEFETKKRAFSYAMLKGGQLTVSDDTVSRYIEVKDADFEFDTGYRTEEKIEVVFLAESPFWLDSALTTEENIVAGDSTLTITPTGSDFIIFPVIEIENDQGVDNPGVFMRNTSDGSMSFTYNDSDFLDGDILIMDSEAGTLQKNNNNAMENLQLPGRFLRLQPFANTIEYEGAACTIRFKYRKVYLF
jgi:hypothetical protein